VKLKGKTRADHSCPAGLGYNKGTPRGKEVRKLKSKTEVGKEETHKERRIRSNIADNKGGASRTSRKGRPKGTKVRTAFDGG